MSGKRWLVVVVGLIVLTACRGAQKQPAVALSPGEQLGQAIFFDQNLSINRNQSCAGCHAPSTGWVGPSETNAVYEGSIPGRFGNRKPPSAGYATTSPFFYLVERGGGAFVGGNFWDGRATGGKLGNPAADQAQGPFLNPREQGLPDSACVVYRVCTAAYPVSYESVWGAGGCAIGWPADVETACATEGATVELSPADRAKSDLAYDNIALSIAAFEASAQVNAFTSKYDAFLAGAAELTPQEQDGLTLFQAKCSQCHVSSGQRPLFTDYTYDNLGLPINPDNPVYLYDPAFVDPGLGGFLATRPDYAQYVEANKGKFQAPTLRNVDLRPSPTFVKVYGHNGYFDSLEEIVHFYNTRDVLPHCDTVSDPQPGVTCWPAPEFAANVNTEELGNLQLTAEDEAAIVAFLKTLSDGYR